MFHASIKFNFFMLSENHPMKYQRDIPIIFLVITTGEFPSPSMKAILKWQAASVLPREVVANEEARARGTKHQNDAGLEKGSQIVNQEKWAFNQQTCFFPSFSDT